MELKRFFTFEPIKNNRIVLKDREHYHATKVCRLKKGFKIIVNANTDKDYYCIIETIEKNSLTAVIEEVKDNPTYSDTDITLYIGVCKELDTVVQKAVEMGVGELVPFVSQNTNTDKIKRDRLEKIILESSKQCGRPNLMKIGDVTNFSNVIETAEDFDRALMFYEYERDVKAGDILTTKDRKLGVIIGSEGGFSEEEKTKAQEKGWRIVTLGKRILRVQTAVVAALALCLEGIEKI